MLTVAKSSECSDASYRFILQACWLPLYSSCRRIFNQDSHLCNLDNQCYLDSNRIFCNRTSKLSIILFSYENGPKSHRRKGSRCSTLTTRFKRHNVNCFRARELQAKFIQATILHSQMDFCPLQNPQFLLAASSLPSLICSLSTLHDRPQPRRSNDNIPHFHRLHPLPHRPCPHSVRDLRALSHMDRPTSHEAPQTRPGRLMFPQLASALSSPRRPFLLA